MDSDTLTLPLSFGIDLLFGSREMSRDAEQDRFIQENDALNTQSDPNPKSDKTTVSGMIYPPCMPNNLQTAQYCNKAVYISRVCNNC